MDSQDKLLKIYNGQVVTPEGIIKNATVIIRSGIIETIAEGNLDAPGATELDAKGKYISSGLIDIQINGFLGVDFSDQDLTIDDLRKATKALWKVGVTTFLPTVITNAQTNLKKSFSILSGALDDEEIGMSISGFHLEGPYISPVQGYRGAHLEKYIRQPDWDEFSELQKAARGRIKLITIAPEVNGAISFTQKCTEAGVVVSLGHHNGPAEIIKQATNAGASMSTHLGNGCANMIDRHLNPLWAQLADDRLTITIIADGFHLNKEEVQCFYKMKGLERTVLVSDALDLAGLPPGEYTRLERVVVLTPDVVKFPAENVLAGAASPLVACVSNMMKFTGCSLENAIQMATANPARSVGLNNIGEIKQGKRADLILFTIEDDRIVVQKTILAGKEVYSITN
ncbi:MAG: N-acetylglucosamine-6-phosphate deacetylase [Bacteroidetes bacterium GWF2_42_66]|nr:MAG: N-acetylglucosamine-6-phosphate deacetylase [Bacteroidetes bacterium GWA2_42_15]OFY01049.1 MAG: N-acetylglucosamine-6-phosphate deacetylase [Bacteroidetes bacterium GWE2_42_39]OFY41892.1 MAG: N-acetylglucosamine-6-phosphate deacetylase [Bacteroidetes bacterium GWF2_42_66]HBL77930.1 N-acetylglucosamine-6-phosphate deacetylase [Prolixibacteraceae bacterium]HCR90153.1 N-acetylglucosamine-6-phosphate deacetylase [Prolixibacteraceae bacterium]